MSVTCVAAVDSSYKKWDSSNYGAAADLGAPGVDIEGPKGNLPPKVTMSDEEASNDELTTASGTSFASGHVAGIAAIIVGWELLNKDIMDCEKVKNRIKANAFGDLMSGWGSNGPNLLANTGISRSDGGLGPVSIDDPTRCRARLLADISTCSMLARLRRWCRRLSLLLSRKRLPRRSRLLYRRQSGSSTLLVPSCCWYSLGSLGTKVAEVVAGHRSAQHPGPGKNYRIQEGAG